MTTKHTPTPWRVRVHPTNDAEFYVAAATPEGHPYFGVTEEIEVMSDEDYPTKRADAALIVRACNAYEDMRKALDTLIRLAHYHSGSCIAFVHLLEAEGPDAIRDAQAALALTEGEA